MALPRNRTRPWLQSLAVPRRRRNGNADDYELYEEDGEFVLTVEMPGFDGDDIEVAWDDGVLNVAAEHEDEDRGAHRDYHRRLRFPKRIDEDGIEARYNSGILEIRLPVETGAAVSGKTIDVQT